MSENPMFGTNEMLVDGSRYLLAGGDKTHLVASGVDGEELRSAVDGWRCESVGEWQQSHDLAALRIERSDGQRGAEHSNATGQMS